MGFFDLCIPYEDSLPSNKTIRMKLVVKAMELGYSGIAYDRTIKGVMSDKDRCSVPLLTLSSLLKLAPSLSSSVEFHRDLLGVSRSAPFRQYTRLTVCVDSPSQVLALNSGNPILKTYNLVSARPLNQNAFDQACEKSEVDIIAIDFSEKLPFRLKQHMIKAAIERGVYFEITYSSIIADVHLRRQLISNSKLLVDWTRGKNLILSSAASSVNELRGPYDVANLSSLLGLSMERAKAALSKNCRTLIANAIRKKQFFKEAVKVEMISSGEKFDPEGPWTGDWLKWDPISSGAGDLLLDDMAKSFAASSNEPKTVKAIDFNLIVGGKPSNGFRVKDLITGSDSASLSLNYNKDIFGVEKLVGVQVATNSLLEQPKQLDQYLQSEPCSFSDAQVKDHDSNSEFVEKFNDIDTINELSNAEIVSNMERGSKILHQTSHGMAVNTEVVSTSCSGMNKPVTFQQSNVNATSDAQVKDHDSNSEFVEKFNDVDTIDELSNAEIVSNMERGSKILHETSHGMAVNAEVVSNSCSGMNTPVTLQLSNVNATSEVSCSANHPISSEYIDCSSGIEEHEGATNSDEVLALGNDLMYNVNTIISENKEDAMFSLDDVAIQEESLEPERFTKPETEGHKMQENFTKLLETFTEPMNQESYLRSCDASKVEEEGGPSIANQLQSDLVMEYKMQQDADKDRSHPIFVQSPSGKCRGKRRTHNRALMFPLKRLLNPVAFKKPHKSKSNK